VDALSYPGFKVVAEALRLELVPIAAAGQGPDPDALERLCAQRRVRALYTMPTLHNPLGWVTSTARRHRLAAIAQRHGLLAIEDAAYAFLVENPPPPIAALAPETTVYVSGLSKSVATGLRVGFVVVPEAWVPRIERSIRATTWSSPGLTTAIACMWLDDGTVHRLEAEKRRDAAQRQAIASEVLSGLPCVRHPAAYFVWLPLPEETRADQIAAALMREGISVATAEPFATSPNVPHALRLALGSVDQDNLRSALQKVRQVIADHSC
jgi:DNA-binding transcriptional MocR family regulator